MATANTEKHGVIWAEKQNAK